MSDSKSTRATGPFSSNSFISPHEENRKDCHPPPDFLLLWSNWAKWSWHSYQLVTVFEVWYVIPGKQGLEKRECSCTAGGKLHPKIKAKIQIGLNYDSVSEKAMAPHSSTLAWKIPWTEEPGRLQSMRSLRVGHDWAASLSLFTFMHWRRKWQPTPVFLPGESQGQRSLVGCRLWGRTESDTSEMT